MILKTLLVIVAAGVFGCGAHDGLNVRAASGETELRGALCEIENGNFATAQTALEKILRAEPQNLAAQRLWPGVLAGQIKKGDRAPENAARTRRAVEAYEQFAKNAAMPESEKTAAAVAVFSLLKHLSPEERTAELRRMASDEQRPPGLRARAYAELADERRLCAAGALEGGRAPAQAELARAKTCATEGLELVRRSLELDERLETAWSAKYYLLDSASRIAGFENDAAQKDARRREAAAALQKYKEASARSTEERFGPAKIETVAEPNSENMAEAFAKELVEYRFEKPVDRLVDRILLPAGDFVELVPDPADQSPADTKKPVPPPSRAWRTLAAPDDEFSAELPERAEKPDASGGPRIYRAVAPGIEFLITASPKPFDLSADQAEIALNNLTWATVLPARNFALMGDKQAAFEVKLAGRDKIDGYPAKVYNFAARYCSGPKPGAIVVVLGKNMTYSIIVSGEPVEGANVQRFLKSLKIGK